MGSTNYEAFQRIAVEKYLSLQSGHQNCPFCSSGFVVESDEDGENEANGAKTREIMCPECSRVFCKFCKERKCTCNEVCFSFRFLVCFEPCLQTNESLVTISKISKPCPRCEAPTERDGGCAHMRCISCGYDWCFICGQKWDIDCQFEHWFE